MTEHTTMTDRSTPAAQRIADLAKASTSPGKSVLVEDEEPLLSALQAGLDFWGVYVLDSIGVPESVARQCQRRGIPITTMSAALATELFKSDKRPDVFGVARTPRPMRAKHFQGRGRDVVILDGVRIVGNIGAIIRSAYAFSAAGVVLTNCDLKSITDRRLIRASRGYVFSLPVAIMTWGQVSALIGEAGLEVALLEAGGRVGLEQVAPRPNPLALVLGSETVGPSEHARRIADMTVSIAMNDAVESLNVSVAAGILLHSRSRRNLARIQAKNASNLNR